MMNGEEEEGKGRAEIIVAVRMCLSISTFKSGEQEQGGGSS